MEVILAQTAGFCMGVDLALQKLDSLVEKEGGARELFTLGPIIHNPQVLESYARRGVTTVDQPEDIPDNAAAVIRAHGVPKEIEAHLRERGVRLIDATCPKVKTAQLLIQRHTKDGRTLLLYGEDSHPEVKGLLSYAGSQAHVFDSEEELASLSVNPEEPCCLAAQTTQDRQEYERITTTLKQDLHDLVVLNTICDATRERQQEALDIANKVDFVVIVGGYNSGNTRRLAQVVADQGKPCIHVERLEELNLEEISTYRNVGISAGASTPRVLIDDIYDALKQL